MMKINLQNLHNNGNGKSQAGFTLVELVVAIAIFTIVTAGLMYLVGVVFQTATSSGDTIADADQTRKLSNQIMQELRNSVTASDGAYAISRADALELSFYSNVDGGTDIEKVRYYISGGKLYRGVIKQSASPINYNGTETSRVVQNDIANTASTPLFYYYDKNFDDNTDTAMTQPVNIANVTYIKMSIDVYKRNSRNNTKYNVTSGAAVRSLKTNL